ncbi:pentapeptide repeat-containing protein [Paenibacillus sp.]|uniref:pentapeptide repeat-containing protein n=1 Tax=Paenibacillus sp. TaxID=58172 RepID=UPI0028244E7C|nr:pentapeptide repeat-containing protein [Paenibacillus sp.]MDR0266770.1 pentapeptide repeat-containing protein [Paenibacillus sp.]
MEQIQFLPSFQSIEKELIFEIRVGEYKDKEITESVFRTNELQRPSVTCKGWLEIGLKHAYMFDHISHVDISQGNYEGIQLNYTRFEQVNVSGSNFKNGLLIGSKFTDCSCGQADFHESIVFDADFRDCGLEGALFDDVIGGRDVMSEKHGTFFGLHGIRFERANLRNASFRNAQIAGDFTHAELEGTDFTGAVLAGSRMLSCDASKVSLTEEQMKSIIWVNH